MSGMYTILLIHNLLRIYQSTIRYHLSSLTKPLVCNQLYICNLLPHCVVLYLVVYHICTAITVIMLDNTGNYVKKSYTIQLLGTESGFKSQNGKTQFGSDICSIRHSTKYYYNIPLTQQSFKRSRGPLFHNDTFLVASWPQYDNIT